LKDIVFPPCQSCYGLARIAAPSSCVSTAAIHLRFGRARKFELRGSRHDAAEIPGSTKVACRISAADTIVADGDVQDSVGSRHVDVRR